MTSASQVLGCNHCHSSCSNVSLGLSLRTHVEPPARKSHAYLRRPLCP
jgi:hypothetical protein